MDIESSIKKNTRIIYNYTNSADTKIRPMQYFYHLKKNESKYFNRTINVSQ